MIQTDRGEHIGVGVGDSSATPTAALLLQIAQETSARLATILFAHRLGTALEPECKRFRFAADIFNDVAMVLDCLSPAVPVRMMLRGMVVSAAGVLRALCGVAAGGSKASLSAHFARAGNIGELNAVRLSLFWHRGRVLTIMDWLGLERLIARNHHLLTRNAGTFSPSRP